MSVTIYNIIGFTITVDFSENYIDITMERNITISTDILLVIIEIPSFRDNLSRANSEAMCKYRVI